MQRHGTPVRLLAATAMTLICSTVSAQDEQAQPIDRMALSMFTKIGTVTDEVWGVDAYYRFNQQYGAFSTLTVVDSAGASGWAADAGIRVGWFQAWKLLYVNFGVGLRLKDLSDGTKVRAITDIRWGLRLGRIIPFYATRYQWPYLGEQGETVWGIAVTVW